MPELTPSKLILLILVGLPLGAYLFLYLLLLLRQVRHLRARIQDLEEENGCLKLLNANLRMEHSSPLHLLNRLASYRHIVHRLLDDAVLNRDDSEWLEREGL